MEQLFKTLTNENGKFTRTTHYASCGGSIFSRDLSAEEILFFKTNKDIFADEVDNYPASTPDEKSEFLVVKTGDSSYIIAQFVAGDDQFMDITDELIEHIESDPNLQCIINYDEEDEEWEFINSLEKLIEGIDKLVK